MSTKRFKEMKNLSKDELASKLREMEADLFQTKIQRATGQLKDTAKVWRIRKDIARIKTLQTLAGAGEKAAPKVAAQKTAKSTKKQAEAKRA